MSLYIKSLERELAQRAEANATSAPSSLRQRLDAWFNGLPLASRNRPYAMSELEAALKVSGRFLSAVLIEAGWTRKRRWEGTKHYYRYWMPPHV